MKHFTKLALIAIAIFALSVNAYAETGLDDFIKSLDVQAEGNIGDFKVQLGAAFGTPTPKIDVLISNVEKPADAYMCLRLAELTGKPVDTVLKEYKTNKNKGWGVIAKNLGIKPGSKNFHELKRGKLSKGKANGDGHGQDTGKHDRDKGKGGKGRK